MYPSKYWGKNYLKRKFFQFVSTSDFSTKKTYFFFNRMLLKDGCPHDSGEIHSGQCSLYSAHDQEKQILLSSGTKS